MTTTVPRHLLLVEDEPTFARLVIRLFQHYAPSEWTITHAQTFEAMAQHLATQAVDFLILDLHLPDSQGLETVARVFELAPTLPMIVLTGIPNGDTALKSRVRGALGFQDKDFLVEQPAAFFTLLATCVASHAREQQILNPPRPEERVPDANGSQ